MVKEMLVFGKWSSDVEVNDPGLKRYINLEARLTFATQGRHAKKMFAKKKVHIIERLINTLMRGGTGSKLGGKVIRDRKGCGKKVKMCTVAEDGLEIINKKSGKNPVELVVQAIENAAPREETTRVKYGGVTYPIAVDISPQRRVDFALRNIGKAVAMRAFKKKTSTAAALADEIMLAANNDSTSHTISKKNEVERIARSSR